MAKRLSHKGVKIASSLGARDESKHTGVVVFDFFAGIGGLLRSLERAGLRWEHHVVIEQDKKCRRCIRRTWPGGSEFTDIKKLSKEEMRTELNRVEKVTLIVAGGGSPCQGLSKLSSKRKHFQDERSQLFYDLAQAMDDLQDLAKELGAKFLGMVENVQMDEADRDEVTLRLGWKPNLCESGDVSWVRRPRFYWLSEDVPQTGWFQIQEQPLGNKIKMFGQMEPDDLWLPEGTVWEARSPTLRFPTFTRPIVRRRPPPDPAGLGHTSDEGRERWEADSFRYPPYVYEQKFLLTDGNDRLHKLPACSREVLMGFKRDHTLKLDRELFQKSSTDDSEDQRCGAIGNSFHTTTVALLLGAILFEMEAIPFVPDPGILMAKLVSEHLEDVLEPITVTGQSDSESQFGGHPTLERLEDDEDLLCLETAQKDLDEEAVHQKLMGSLVHNFIRKVEFRGSDVRMDTNTIFKPSGIPRSSIDPSKWVWRECRAFRWRHSEHINLLEFKAALHAIQWRARRGRFHSFRTMLLIDNQSVLAVIAKGRSSSRNINHLLRRLAALCCCLNLYLLVAYVDTSDNPADQGSRIFESHGDR